MTTIVLKDGVLAADGMASVGSLIITKNAKKIESDANGLFLGEKVIAFAVSGSASDDKVMKHFMQTDEGITVTSEITKSSEFMAIVITDGGSYGAYSKIDSGNIDIWNIYDDYYAIGSGATHALACIRAIPSCTAIEAVQFAAEWDCYTGGVITSLDTNK